MSLGSGPLPLSNGATGCRDRAIGFSSLSRPGRDAIPDAFHDTLSEGEGIARSGALHCIRDTSRAANRLNQPLTRT